MARLSVIAVLLVLVATPARAATEAERESRRHFQAAEAHFKAGAFDKALTSYQAGYEAKPLPGFLINIAQCQRRLGDLKASRASYQKFIMVAPDSPLVPQAKTMVEELDRLLAEIAEAAPPPAEAADAAPPAAKPPAEPPSVPAAAEPASPAAQAVLVAQPAPAPEEPRAPARRRWWLWGALGAVVVGGTVTAIVLSTGGTTTTLHDGSLGTLRR
jgi:hypothetical protein